MVWFLIKGYALILSILNMLGNRKIRYLFLVARLLKGGRGPLRKNPFFEAREKKIKNFLATKLEGVGVRP